MTTPRTSALHSRQTSSAQTPKAVTTEPILTAPPLPPADTFDFLPPLYALLRRLQQPSGLDAQTATDGSPSKLERTDSKDENAPLELKNLETAASAIRIKIERARKAVRGVVDGERTVEEQKVEIEELEERVERQKAMLRKLGVRMDGEGLNG